MSDTFTRECHYCHQETDCIQNENGYWMCESCRLKEKDGENTMTESRLDKIMNNEELIKTRKK